MVDVDVFVSRKERFEGLEKVKNTFMAAQKQGLGEVFARRAQFPINDHPPECTAGAERVGLMCAMPVTFATWPPPAACPSACPPAASSAPVAHPRLPAVLQPVVTRLFGGPPSARSAAEAEQCSSVVAPHAAGAAGSSPGQSAAPPADDAAHSSVMPQAAAPAAPGKQVRRYDSATNCITQQIACTAYALPAWTLHWTSSCAVLQEDAWQACCVDLPGSCDLRYTHETEHTTSQP